MTPENLSKIRVLDLISNGLVKGHFVLEQIAPHFWWHSERRILTEDLWNLRDFFIPELAKLILQESTSGFIGLKCKPGIDWVPEMQRYLERQGVEFPITEICVDGRIWGTPLYEYNPRLPVTVFAEINTLGGTLEELRGFLERQQGISVGRAVSLIDRNPHGCKVIGRIPFRAVLAVPLPLFQPGDCVQCQAGQKGAELLWS